MSERRGYNIHLPLKRLGEIQEMIKNLPERSEKEIRDKKILELVFIEGLTTKDIEESGEFISSWGKNTSQRRIQQIVQDYVPDYRSCRKKEKKYSDEYYKLRAEQAKIRKTMKQECCICGCHYRLELHHMIPLGIGGTNDERNCIILCRTCHEKANKYFKFLYENNMLKLQMRKHKIRVGDRKAIPGQLKFPF